MQWEGTVKKLCTLLVIAVGPAAIAACFALLTPQRSSAYNEYNNEYRKWLWRAGDDEIITTLPLGRAKAMIATPNRKGMLSRCESS
jgi:hypothetical protein